jgi:exodeoxyribonuclease-3
MSAYTAPVRIATWNVNGVRRRLPYLRRWLRDRKPDIVSLQKIRVPEEEFPTSDFESLGYHAVAFCRKGEYGVGILSRKEPNVVQKGLPGHEGLGSRLLTVDVDGLEFSSVYAPYGQVEGYERKLAWLQSLEQHVRATHRRSAQRSLCGDFNVVPEDRDNSSGAVNPGALNYTAGERNQLSAGLTDLYAHLHPHGQERFTYWPYALNSDSLRFGVRLDLMLSTTPIVDRVRAVWVDMDYRRAIDDLRPSECAPVVADLSASKR